MSYKSSSSSASASASATSGGSCFGCITFILFVWFLIFGFTYGGVKYAIDCNTENGVQLDKTKLDAGN